MWLDVDKTSLLSDQMPLSQSKDQIYPRAFTALNSNYVKHDIKCRWTAFIKHFQGFTDHSKYFYIETLTLQIRDEH